MQKSYNYHTPKGVAGGPMDIAPHSIDSRINGETDDGAMLFGMGVVQGGSPGLDVKVPATGVTAAQFEGVVMTGFTQQMDLNGAVKILKGQTVSVLRYGKAWARIAPDVSPAYGEPLYLITEGDSAGMFTNEADGALVVKGRFIGGADAGAIAPVEIYNQAAQ